MIEPEKNQLASQAVDRSESQQTQPQEAGEKEKPQLQAPGESTQLKQTGDVSVSDDWLRLMYAEAWKQYIHEDTQGQARVSIFLTVQTALIAILAIITKPLLDMPPKQIGSHQVYIGVGLLGLFTVIIGVFSLFLGVIWRSVNKAARITMNLRWIPIAAIERIARLNDVNLAGLEHEWRRSSREKPDADYKPYESIAELAEFRLGPLPKFRGWSSISWTISGIQVLFALITLGGLMLLGITVYRWLSS